MNKENTESFQSAEEWFRTIADKTERGLRDFLRGERPADAGASKTQKVSDRTALLLYNYDLEMMRYKLRCKFSESAIFDREEIKYLKKTFDLNEHQAEAVRFANLIILRNEYVKDCIKIFEDFISMTLDAAFKTIDTEGVPNTLREFRKVSNEAKTRFVERVGFSYIERLKQNPHLYIKTPNVGRPHDTEDKTERIKLAIKELFEENFGSINELNMDDILNGKISTPKITKFQVAAKLKISRPSFDAWLHNSNLDFEEQVNQIQVKFYKELKNNRDGYRTCLQFFEKYFLLG